MSSPRLRVPIVVLALVALAGAADARWSADDRARALDGGRVEGAVIEALDAADEVAVVVAYRGPARGRAHRGKRTAVADGLLDQLAPADFRVTRRFDSANGLAGRVTRRGLLRLLALDAVERIGVDRQITAQLDEAVPLVSLDELQVAGYDGSGQVVAVIDTGIDSDHEDLTGAVIAEQCFCQGGCCPNNMDTDSGPGSAEDDHGHGTRVAGVVASNGTSAPVGGAPGAELVSVKVLASNASGQFSDMVSALEWIAANRPDVTVVNLSLGGGLFAGDCDTAALDIEMAAAAIQDLWDADVPTMAGSGNNGSGSGMIAPACISTAISVSAVWDEDLGSQTWLGCNDPVTAPDLVTCFGNSSTTTDVFGPGALITSSLRNGGSTTKAGTSYATPMVAACAAVLLEAVPGLSASDLEAGLESSLVGVTDPKNGLTFPRLDCAFALDRLVIPTPAVGPSGLAVAALLLLGAGGAALRRERSGPR